MWLSPSPLELRPGEIVSLFIDCARRPDTGKGSPLPMGNLWLDEPLSAEEPTDYWLSTLPEDTPIEELVRLAKIRCRIEHGYRELKHGQGLDHFEGRSYRGWHRHLTLAVLAILRFSRWASRS